MGFPCHVCGKEHDGLPDLGADYPDQWFGIPPVERAARVKISSDLCRIDGNAFYIRGVLRLPLVDGPGEYFGVGVWVSQSPQNFQTYVEHFEDSSGIGPFFGWLCTRIRTYAPDTFGLKTMARFQPGNQRPLIEVEPTDHPLSIDQRNGISVGRAWEVVHAYMPKAPG